ncbi:hypothetical protein PB1_11859 [Bacillus methanolicus PB1]|uniref:Uncharacterized protein n=1 Tax=Bacillus methanolicus PB1 TaxID=997296 RepID=I3DVI3_BACMT|nr:hypothetical protein PB1_11859 [Bacillus methanolicus PB1]
MVKKEPAIRIAWLLLSYLALSRKSVVFSVFLFQFVHGEGFLFVTI